MKMPRTSRVFLLGSVDPISGGKPKKRYRELLALLRMRIMFSFQTT
jgi:hypothetical protein